MEIRIDQSLSSEKINFLTQKINEENQLVGLSFPFGFFINANEEIVGGANGSVVFGSIYTDQLWIASKHRGQGLGRTLMETIHSYGRDHGCTMATVSTMDFQNAKGFYEKLGYQVDFERKGYVHDSTFLFLKKEL